MSVQCSDVQDGTWPGAGRRRSPACCGAMGRSRRWTGTPPPAATPSPGLTGRAGGGGSSLGVGGGWGRWWCAWPPRHTTPASPWSRGRGSASRSPVPGPAPRPGTAWATLLQLSSYETSGHKMTTSGSARHKHAQHQNSVLLEQVRKLNWVAEPELVLSIK